MNKAKNGYINNLRYIFLFGVIAFGLIAIVGSGGGGGGNDYMTCSPAPQITSTPPTQATVGQIYTYTIVAKHECGFLPFVCSDVNILEMPPGAIYTPDSRTITWTPSISQANNIVQFRIATVPDY